MDFSFCVIWIDFYKSSHILLVTWALMICLICMPSGFEHTYKANSSCTCYNYYKAHPSNHIATYTQWTLYQIAYYLSGMYITDEHSTWLIMNTAPYHP